MPNDAQPNPNQQTEENPRWLDAADWVAQFSKLLELEFNSVPQEVAGEAMDDTYRQSITRAFLNVLADSGASTEEISGLIQNALRSTHPQEVEWTDEKNVRRVELIDKKIQGDIAPEERMELARLQQEASTYLNRQSPLPIEAARRMHKELLEKKRQHDEQQPQD